MPDILPFLRFRPKKCNVLSSLVFINWRCPLHAHCPTSHRPASHVPLFCMRGDPLSDPIRSSGPPPPPPPPPRLRNVTWMRSSQQKTRNYHIEIIVSSSSFAKLAVTWELMLDWETGGWLETFLSLSCRSPTDKLLKCHLSEVLVRILVNFYKKSYTLLSYPPFARTEQLI